MAEPTMGYREAWLSRGRQMNGTGEFAELGPWYPPESWRRVAAERDALAARVETLEAQRDEALKALSTKGATNYEKVQAAGLILSGEGGSA